MSQEFKKGQRFGPYILQEELGRGTYGVVWLAERRAELTTTQFALKFPLDPDVDVEAVRKEAKLWVQASGHPNIIPVFEAAIYSGQIVIVSEYAPEGTLKDWLKRCGGKAPDIHSAVAMCTGILAGLKHLHSKKLLHRDLKPGNILLQGELPRIADFGLARVLRSVTSTRAIAGTPAYMAPEVWQGDRCFESDIWSVGVILYEMLAGHRPFQATRADDFSAVLEGEEPPTLPLSVPATLGNVVLKSLAKQKEQRFHSAEEMLAALTGRPVSRRADEETPPNPLLAAELHNLLQELEGPTPQQRAKAARQLGRLGSGAVPVARALCATCNDPSPLVQQAIVKALRDLLADGSTGGRKVRAVVVENLRALRTPAARHCMSELGIR
jgi:serine/threonine protein kinase